MGLVTVKKQRITQKFEEEYSKEWPCLLRSLESDSSVFCSVCSRDFSVAHGGSDDCRKHVISKIHADADETQGHTQ